MPFPKSASLKASAEGSLLAPWAATGRLNAQDRRLFEVAMVSDPTLADDLAAARAEHAAVTALGEALGRPSARPMLALFAAIEADQELGANVTRLKFHRSRSTPQVDPKIKKFCLRR